MFKLIVSILVAMFACGISGCWQTVNIDDMNAAAKICKGYSSSVVEINANFVGDEHVLCSNRVSYLIDGAAVQEVK